MATGQQVVAAIDDTLKLSGQGCRYWRDRLAGARLIAASKGKPTFTPSTDIATLLIAVMVGSPAALRPELALEYGALSSLEGERLQSILAGYLDAPHDLLGLSVESSVPAVAIRHRDKTGNVVETMFLPDIVPPREGISRMSHLDGNAFTALALAIKSAPSPQLGRRNRRRRKFPT